MLRYSQGEKVRLKSGVESILLALAAVTLLSLPANATISYTCAPGIDLFQANTCAYLNSTIADIYSGTFSNATAYVYIQYGTTGLGQSLTEYESSTYTDVRNAMVSETLSPDQASAYEASLPFSAPAPFTDGTIFVTNADERALNLGTSFAGVTQTGGPCGTVNGTTCFDSVITVSNSVKGKGDLWFRALSGGPQGSGQYDFFTVVEHETDEVLGTSSCAFQTASGLCSAGNYLPLDLFRYAGNGSRSFADGDNNPCSTNEASNACFSIDGGNTFLASYNDVRPDDAGDFSSNCQHVQDAIGCPGQSLDINSNGGVEIRMLNVAGYELVPEPASACLLAGGLGLLFVLRSWRRRQRRA